MELRRGRVSNVRLGSELIAQSGKHGTNVSTHHYATFDLDGVPAQASAARPLTVSDGNDVVLAGKMKDGVFVAAACRNLTRGTIDRVSWWGGLVVGPVFHCGQHRHFFSASRVGHRALVCAHPRDIRHSRQRRSVDVRETTSRNFGGATVARRLDFRTANVLAQANGPTRGEISRNAPSRAAIEGFLLSPDTAR